MARLHGSLALEEVLDDKGVTLTRAGRPVWRLLEPLEWHLDNPVDELFIAVPAGFETDLASVPAIVRGLIPASGPWQRAAILHDWIYSHAGKIAYQCRRANELKIFENIEISRARADGVFYQAMRASGVVPPVAAAMWAAVRIGGWVGWGH